jgi:hypothetical protein
MARTRTKERRGALIVALGRRVETVVAKSLDGSMEARRGIYLNPEGKSAIGRIWREVHGRACSSWIFPGKHWTTVAVNL